MLADDLLVKLKATGSKADLYDIVLFSKEYKIISDKLNNSDKRAFALNILCVLCRNFEKVPTWGDRVDSKALLTLCIGCIRDTQGIDGQDGVKVLACIFHIHRYFTRTKSPVPPELLLKLSYMPFEADTKELYNDYAKTYCSMLLDRLSYIGKLKAKANITKLLPKLNEDIIKVIEMYDTGLFCLSVLMFLMTKMNFLYNEYPKQLKDVFQSMFEKISTKKDLKSFKSLTEKELLQIYSNFNNCFYIIAENCFKTNVESSILDSTVRTCVAAVGHAPDLYHCMQTFYLNSYCCMLTSYQNQLYIETVLNNVLLAFESTEKMGYGKAMNATYPFLSQLMKLYFEKFFKDLSSQAYITYMELILRLMKKLKHCKQLMQCDNCKVSTGLHDSLKLAFLARNVLLSAVNMSYDINEIFNIYLTVVNEQNVTLLELARSGCVNYSNFSNKLQADVHNIAISLNKSNFYAHSVKLFDIYIKTEMMSVKDENELKNISRALFNKSICELDLKLYEKALLDAYLSLVFARENGTKSDKYMSMVIDVKSKALKASDGEDNSLQLLTILDACQMAANKPYYENISSFFLSIKFSVFLKHEFSMYVKMWPSMAPIAGVCNSLMTLTNFKEQPLWMMRENDDVLRWTLYELVLETPLVVRTLQSDCYKTIVGSLLEALDNGQMMSSDLQVIHVTLMFLKTEYDIAEAALKHQWKVSEPDMDPDNYVCNRRLPEEYAAHRHAFRAVAMWTSLVNDLVTVSKTTCLGYSLQISQLFVQHMLRMYCTVEAVQLAHICCMVAKHIGDMNAYVRNAGVLLRHLDMKCEELNSVMETAAAALPGLLASVGTAETTIIFICDAAIFYKRCGSVGASARLVRLAQSHVLNVSEKCPDLNFDLAIGRLLEAQSFLCGDAGISALSAASGIQRHYLSIGNNSYTTWCSRRLHGLIVKYHTTMSSVASVRVARALRLWRRGRGASGAALPATTSPAQAELFALISNPHQTNDAQVKISRLKYILGLEPSNKPQDYKDKKPTEETGDTLMPEVESMLESFVLKDESLPFRCTVQSFKLPDIFHHDASCECHCRLPALYILACQTSSLEASTYYRANEFNIADNYFKGTKRMLCMAEKKLESIFSTNHYKYIIDSASRSIASELRRVRIEFLIEMCFFQLSKGDFKEADDLIVTIHEITDIGSVDSYLMNDVMNLMTASAQLRGGIIKKPQDLDGLEMEMDELKLSPTVSGMCTPKIKVPIPGLLKVKVKNEELLQRVKVIKLSLEEADENVPVVKKNSFKVPEVITSKPILEDITPKPKRSIPKLILTQPSVETVATLATPNIKRTTENNEFRTPIESPEQFFTPMSSFKTYTNVRAGVVKKLDEEFSTPQKKKKLSAPVRSRSKAKVEGLRMLKRATSPGKLEKESVPQNRTRKQRIVDNTDSKQ